MDKTVTLLDQKCKALERQIADISVELPDLQGLAYSEKHNTLQACKKSLAETKNQISNISKL